MSTPQVPSIRQRLANALAVWSLAWGAAVGAAIWLAATHEVDELLDDTLQASTELLGSLLPATLPSAAQAGAAPGTERFAWQLVAADGRLLARSARAPAAPWHTRPAPGFTQLPGWRVYGMAAQTPGQTPGHTPGQMLYAAQTGDERREARGEVALNAVLAALALGLLGHVWLRSRVRRELEPLRSLSHRLAGMGTGMGTGRALTPEAAAQALGAPERQELEPVHQAVQALTARLWARMASERAFSAHAAHALRTPLAGIDAQLAVALRECPPALRERLTLVRGATGRLQAVVVALLGLFRAGSQPQRAPVDVGSLVARLPAPGVQVTVQVAVQTDSPAPLDADADLLAAALVNLLDNSARHGAKQVSVQVLGPRTLRVSDDGPGVPPQRAQALLQALDHAQSQGLDGESTEGMTGLGLLLADRVARAHGGRLRLPDSAAGFVVELDLGEA